MAASGEQPQVTLMGYHSTDFWKKLRIGVVEPADLGTVVAATRDLCRHFVALEEPALFMEKAARLAAQFRNLKDGRFTELLVDHAGLRELFTLDPSVLFDLRVYSWDVKVAQSSSEESIQTVDSSELLVDGESTFDEKATSLSWLEGFFPKKTNSKKPEEPPTVQQDSLAAPPHLCFSNIDLYAEEDHAWLEDFISSVDRLTVAQALVFGPAFACLCVISRIPACMPSGISEVAEQLAKLCDTSLDRGSLDILEMVGRLEVKMPPLEKLKELLSVYAEVKPAPVYFNTVVGGLMYASHKRKWSLLTEDSVTFVLLSTRAYHDYHTPLASSLEHIRIMARLHKCPRLAGLYFAFVERSFPESWKAFCRVSENFNAPRLGKYDPFWDYSRAFSDEVFDELSYERNHRACNVTAVFEDLLYAQPGSCVWPTYGYTYENLVGDKPTALRISRGDAVLAEGMLDMLRKECR